MLTNEDRRITMILKIILNENTRVSPSFFLFWRMVHDYPPLINRKDNPGAMCSGIVFFLVLLNSALEIGSYCISLPRIVNCRRMEGMIKE
jgi:hypothetical protein